MIQVVLDKHLRLL
jgi:signal-transduction protein with cAMP-binding, CBS, and nucleotidyltransferase domain